MSVPTWKVSYMQKGYSWNPSTYIFENSGYLKSFVDDLVILCDEI